MPYLMQVRPKKQSVKVQLLAKLGGWEPHKDRRPGKMTLKRGLGRLFEMLATQAMLSGYAAQHQGLPPKIAAFLHGWHPPGELCEEVRRSYHRPLSWYFRTLRASGMVVAALEEPEPTEELLENSEQGPWIAEIPLHCVIEAWKIE